MPHQRTVLVLGATSGIGLASALRFATRSDHLVLHSRSEESLAIAAAECRRAGAGSVQTVAGDIAEAGAAELAVNTAVQLHGRLDVVVQTSATMAYGRIEAMPREVFESVVATTVLGTANTARVVLPTFRRQGGGIFIVVNSLLGSVTVPEMGAYAAAKWGQRALIRTLQQELRAERDIRVCLVSPGSVNTPIYYQAANFLGRGVRPPRPVRSPEKIAAVITRLADRPRQHVSVPAGMTNPLVIIGFRLAPFVYDRIVARAFRLAATTRERVAATTGNVLTSCPAGERVHGRWPGPRGDHMPESG